MIAAVIAVAAVVSLSLALRVKEEGIMVYQYQNRYNAAGLGLDTEDGTFTFSQFPLLSSWEKGTYKKKGCFLTAETEEGNRYTFLNLGKYLVFFQDLSSEVIPVHVKAGDDGEKAIKNFGIFVFKSQH